MSNNFIIVSIGTFFCFRLTEDNQWSRESCRLN